MLKMKKIYVLLIFLLLIGCKKEVVVYGVSHAPGIEGELEQLRKNAEAEGKIILFNPPPFGQYSCPDCGTELIQK